MDGSELYLQGCSMPKLNIRQISHDSPTAAEQLLSLRHQISLQANVVSPRGRQLTENVFGQALAPAEVVERVCGDVRA